MSTLIKILGPFILEKVIDHVDNMVEEEGFQEGLKNKLTSFLEENPEEEASLGNLADNIDLKELIVEVLKSALNGTIK